MHLANNPDFQTLLRLIHNSLDSAMTSAQVVETSLSVTTNNPSQDYTHPDDHTSPTSDMTLGLKPFTVKYNEYIRV